MLSWNLAVTSDGGDFCVCCCRRLLILRPQQRNIFRFIKQAINAIKKKKEFISKATVKLSLILSQNRSMFKYLVKMTESVADTIGMHFLSFPWVPHKHQSCKRRLLVCSHRAAFP